MSFSIYIIQAAVKSSKSNPVGTSVFAMDNVACKGTESLLAKCPHEVKDDCSATEGAGVVCDTRNKTVIDTETRLVDTCFTTGVSFETLLKIDNTTVGSVTECQALCQRHEDCTHFSYLFGECIRTSGNEKVDADRFAVAGPKQCSPSEVLTASSPGLQLLGGKVGHIVQYLMQSIGLE